MSATHQPTPGDEEDGDGLEEAASSVGPYNDSSDVPRSRARITWSPQAEEALRQTMRADEIGLRRESLRIARRNDACVVSSPYVRQAAERLKLRQLNSPVGEVLIPVGLSLATPGIGVFVTMMTAQNTVRLDGWFVGAVIVAALLGMLAVGIGLTLKLRR